jgi:hypothetical protein
MCAQEIKFRRRRRRRRRENHTQLQENRILREQKERIERLDHIHALSLAQQVERKHTNHTPRRNVGDSLRFRIRI